MFKAQIYLCGGFQINVPEQRQKMVICGCKGTLQRCQLTSALITDVSYVSWGCKNRSRNYRKICCMLFCLLICLDAVGTEAFDASWGEGQDWSCCISECYIQYKLLKVIFLAWTECALCVLCSHAVTDWLRRFSLFISPLPHSTPAVIHLFPFFCSCSRTFLVSYCQDNHFLITFYVCISCLVP